jgi:two-component system, NarL family, sensor histidine kinase DesK
VTLARRAARRWRGRWLREDSGVSVYVRWRPGRASGAARDHLPAGAAPAADADSWPLPGYRSRKLLIAAAVGYFTLVPAITDIVAQVTPTTLFIMAGSVGFASLTCWQVLLRDRPGASGVPWAWLIVLVALAIAVFAAARGQSWLSILAIAAAACGRFAATVRPAAFGAVACGSAALIVTTLQGQSLGTVNTLLFIILPPMTAYLSYTATKRIDMVAELRQTRAELARVAVAGERLRIARDLHDLLGQSLSLITLKAELSRRMVSTDAGAAEREMAELEQVARQSLGDVRAAVAGYRQPELAAELGVARQLLAAAGVSCQITTPADPGLPAPVDTVLAWAVREGVTNVARHAHATSAGVTVATTGDHVVAEITDNGSGPLGGAAGSGLAGLGERVRQLGGNLMAGPAPGGGFRLQVTIPLTVRHP